MKARWILPHLLAAALVITGCATNTELTQKEKDRIAREMERESQKQARAQAQAQDRALRQATGGNQDRGFRTGLGGR